MRGGEGGATEMLAVVVGGVNKNYSKMPFTVKLR